MLHISFAPAPLSSAWIFVCLLNYLPASLPILLLMVVKSLKSYLYYFSWKCIVFRYWYRSLVSVRFSCIAWLAFAWRANIPYAVPCHLSDITSCHVNTWHLTCYYMAIAPYYNMTCHPPPVILIPDLWLSHLREYYTCYPVLHTVTWILYLLSCIIYTVTWIYNTHVLQNSWSCLALVIPINW